MSASASSTAAPRSPVIVVPCFNEERRLDEDAFAELGRSRRRYAPLRRRRLDRRHARGAGPHGQGRADGDRGPHPGAQRRQGRGRAAWPPRAARNGAATVGYYDADLATPPDRAPAPGRDVSQARPELAGVLGSRVARLGSSIERNAAAPLPGSGLRHAGLRGARDHRVRHPVRGQGVPRRTTPSCAALPRPSARRGPSTSSSCTGCSPVRPGCRPWRPSRSSRSRSTAGGTYGDRRCASAPRCGPSPIWSWWASPGGEADRDPPGARHRLGRSGVAARPRHRRATFPTSSSSAPSARGRRRCTTG